MDAETKDEHIDKGQGSGWVYGDVKLLGMAIKVEEQPAYYETDIDKIRRVAENADTIIAHNAQYDVGLLLSLGVKIRNKRIVDTETWARLLRNDGS